MYVMHKLPEYQNFLQHCLLCLSIQHNNNLDSSTKLFSDLYLAKLLDTSAKNCSFRVCFVEL